mmetsp:Transcript_16224/g.21319  ORF Transcript_16224/g.21319 Transcript_16224/m.21319 type:complete len:401 (-) Transcript_16224:770-1972(-)|eukprot:CAMPEP_0184018350 /NCGR_PEP_ID=MMETSP0954-20121128/8099_1 /TAXON_ID=627963 /ORGANISM="Aplanochytrium sp, Strain PBS07" /LENGTH=400 /DNA_ID=CAMNT_0026299799 /DNA_START=73 /DNA_END=1275 /DNA_ORIENTATION=-
MSEMDSEAGAQLKYEEPKGKWFMRSRSDKLEGCKKCCKKCCKVCFAITLLTVVVLLITFAIFASNSKEAANFPVYSLLPEDKVWVIAHRGGNNLWPDNTVFAFKNAMALGSDILEFDVRLTSDNEVVVIHDETTGETTEVDSRVQDLTLAELQSLDAGYSFGSLYRETAAFDSPERSDPAQTFPFRGLGLRIPTLVEVFVEFPDVPKLIEMKALVEGLENPTVPDDLIANLCDLIQTYNQTDKVIIGSFLQDAVESFRDICPDVSVSPGYSSIFSLYLAAMFGMEKAVSPAYETISIPESVDIGPFTIEVTKKRMFEAAKNRNVKTGVWTINDVDSMEELIERGARGIITDRVDLLQNLNGNLTEENIVTLEELQATGTGEACINNATLLTTAGCEYLGL